MVKYLSGRNKRTPQSGLRDNINRYLSIGDAEPNFGDPVSPGDIVPVGQQYQVVSIEGFPGERYWVPVGGGLIPGSISVYDEGYLVGGINSTTQLHIVGAAITAKGITSPQPGVAVTITVFAPGNNKEILFNTANEFSTSTKLTFDTSNGLLTAGDRITVGAGGTVITTTGIGLVGIGTTNPTQELHVQGDLRLTGTIYDFNNQPGNTSEVLVKNNFGGLTWINQSTIRAGAGGTYQNIQFHNNVGLVDGASNFVYDEVNSRIGIGSTQPKVLLDVLGISSFRGGTTIDNLNITGVTTTSSLAVSGTSTTRNLLVTGVSTIGFVTGTSAFFTGIVTASKFVGALEVSQLYVTGISTFLQKVNINNDLGVTGLTTTQNLQVYQSTTLNRLNVSGVSTFTSQVNVNNLNVTGVGTFDNIKLDTNTVSTNTGNLILDSSGGTTQINDAVYVNDTTESTSKDNGSFFTEGGVGIEKNLNVGGSFRVLGITTLAASGGITTTGGDLYVGGNLYLNQDIFQDEIFARNGFFTGITSTKDLLVTGIATIATLGVSGLTTTRDLRVIGISTFDGLLDANAGATIDNIQIGISGDNEIDTSTGNLIIDSFSGTTTIDDQLVVSGVSTFSSNVTFGDATTDRVNFISRVGTGITPSVTDTYDLGSSTLRWNNVYAKTFVGAITGNADTATKLLTARDFSIDGNNNTTINAGDVSASAIAFDGSANVVLRGSLKNVTGLSAGTYGNSVTVPIVSVNSQGIVTSITSVAVNFSTATVANADKVATVTRSTDATHYITFVDSDNNPVTYESVYTDAGVTYNPSTNLLTSGNLIVSGITTFQGNVTIGDANTDTVTFNSRVNSSVLPSTNGTLDLGGSSNRWNTVYANTFDGVARVTTTDLQTGNLLVTGIATVNGFFRPSVGSGADKGIYWATDPGGGSGDEAFIRYYVESGENTRLHIGIKNDADDDIYLESSEVFTSGKLTVSGDATFNGNVTIGNANTDIVSFTSRVGTGITPSVTDTYDLGSSTLRWNNVYAKTFVGAITGNADTATRANYADNAGISTNLKGGIASQIPYQTAPNTTAFIPNGTSGQLLQSNGTSAPSWVNPGSLSADRANYATRAGLATDLEINGTNQLLYQASNNDTQLLSQGSSGQLLQSNGASAPSWVNPGSLSADRANYADNAGISTNLKGGIASQIPYQTAANTTAFIPNGTSGQLLQSNGTSAPSWVTPSGLSVSKADYATRAGLATDLEINGTNQLLYQASNNDTQLLSQGSSGQLLQSNGASAPSWVSPSNLTAGKSDVAVQLSPRSSSDYRIIDTQGTYIHWNRTNGDGATWLINQRGLGAGGFYFADSTSSASNTFGSTTGLTQTMSLSANGLLTVNAIKPTSIQDSSGGTGTNNFVLTANGIGGWAWRSTGTIGAIGGITIQEEGTPVGTQLGITTVNFIGGSVTATSPTTGTANISIVAASNVTVTQTSYNCTNPITVTGGSQINIASNSNAYGRKFVQTTEPTGACDGDIWYDTTSGGGSSGGVPAGTVIYYAGSSAPTGYLSANGAAISRTTYSALFTALGTTYGAGDGSTTFNLPDLRNRFSVGSGPSYALGATGGVDTVTLTTAQMPSHNHTASTDGAGAHSHSGTTGGAGAHSHTVPTTNQSGEGNQTEQGLTTGDSSNISTSAVGNHTHSFSTSSVGNHTHTVTVENAGSNQAHENRPPYIALLACIKF